LLGFGFAVAFIAFLFEVAYYWIMKATKQWFMGAPKLVRQCQVVEAEVDDEVYPWVD
jgi:hypothetical protein